MLSSLPVWTGSAPLKSIIPLAALALIVSVAVAAAQAPDSKTPDTKTPDAKTLDSKTSGVKVPDASKPDAKTLTARADDFALKGDNDRAMADYNEALKADPVFVDALIGRARVWRAKGDRRRALADLDAALKLKPDAEAARSQRKELFNEIELLGARMPLKSDRAK